MKRHRDSGNRVFGRIIAFALAVMIAASPAGRVWAAEGGAGENTAAESGAAATAAPETAAAPLPVLPSSGTPVETPADDDPAAENFSVTGYEIYGLGDSKDTLDVIRKGRHARMVVYGKNSKIMTSDVTAGSLRITKTHDSFRSSGNPKIKITSEKDETLEFTVTFSKLTYQGKGSELKFKINNKKDDAAAELMTVTVTECEEDENVSGDGGYVAGNPVLKVRRISPQSPVGAGEKFTLILEMENTSDDADIEDLTVSVNPGTAFFITDDTNSRLIKRLDTNRTEEIRLDMTAARELAGPSQILELDLKYNYYSNGQLTSGTASQKVVIPVAGGMAPGQPVIKVSRGEIAAPVQAGQAFDVVIRLENTSTDREIRNLAVTLEPNDQIALMDQTDTKPAGTLAAGQAVEIPVKLKAGAELSSAASQLLGLSMKFDYDSDKGVVQGVYTEKLVIPMNGGQANPAGPTPNIIIKNYAYGEKVTAGQVFVLEMELSNTSGQTPVENVVMSLETGEGISINSSSNTLYLPRLGAGETKQEKVEVQALFQSKLQSPKITISFKYEYMDKKERKQAVSTETIAIPVYQPDRFELKKPSYSEGIRVNEEGIISIPYVNKGRGSVFNVEAVLDCDVKALEKELTPGNFEAGKSGTLDFIITPEQAGTMTGEVNISYEDEAMTVRQLKVPLEFAVQEAQEMEEMMDEGADMSEAPSGKGRLLAVAAAAAVVIILIIAVSLKRRKRKKREAVEQTWDGDELWDDEEPLLIEEDLKITDGAGASDADSDGGKSL